MPIEYNTKEEAEAAVMQMKSVPPEIFCPLFGNTCNENCPCYQYPKYLQQYMYSKDKPDKFWVYEACCDNAMFTNSCHGGC